MELDAIESVREGLYRNIAMIVQKKFRELNDASQCRCYKKSMRAIQQFLSLSQNQEEQIFLDLVGSEVVEVQTLASFRRTSIANLITLVNTTMKAGIQPYSTGSKSCFTWEPRWINHHRFDVASIPYIICKADYFSSIANRQMSIRRHDLGLNSSLHRSSVIDTALSLGHHAQLRPQSQPLLLTAGSSRRWRITRISNFVFCFEGAFYLEQQLYADSLYIHCRAQFPLPPGAKYFLDIVGHDIDGIYYTGRIIHRLTYVSRRADPSLLR